MIVYSSPGFVLSQICSIKFWGNLTSLFADLKKLAKMFPQTFQFIKIENHAFQCSKSIELFQCKECSKFQTHFLVCLKRHSKDHRSEEPKELSYKCRKCTFETYSKFLLLTHGLVKACASTNPKTRTRKANSSHCHDYVCSYCSFTTKKQSYLTRHVRNRHTAEDQIQWFHCEQCSSKYRYHYKLRFHMKLKHSDECEKCQIKFKTNLELKIHMKTHHRKSVKVCRYQCDLSPSSFVNQNNDSPQSDKTYLFHCDQCTYKTNSKYLLKQHVIFKHTAEDKIDWFCCDLCPSKFKDNKGLQRHVKRMHMSSKDCVFKCGYCKIKTKDESLLREHFISGHGETKQTVDLFQCEACSKCFKSEADLLSHKEVQHGGEKWFYCEQCTYKSRNKPDLRRHVLVKHTPENQIDWFACGECTAMFKTRDYLQKHTKYVHMYS